MKNSAKFMLISGLIYASNSFGLQPIDANEKSIPDSASCDKVVNFTIYGENTHQLYSVLSTDNNDYFVSNLSSITVYNPKKQIIVNGEFSQPSNYAPRNGDYLVAWQNGKSKLNINHLIESDRDKVIGQVRFTIRRVPIGTSGVQPKLNLVSTVFNKDDPLKYSSIDHGFNTKSFDTNMATTSIDCLNILPRWCGDGIIDVSEGEICDDGKKNGKSGQCSTSCKN